MKKRVMAWLLVFCMTLSLLPGTAFASENTGGGDDGKITITYNLNDGKTDYELQLKTDPNTPPLNEPGAVWAGRPFDGWTSDEDGNIQADYSKSGTLYAQWLDGYTVYLDFGDKVSISIPGLTPESGTNAKFKFTTEKSGKLPADTVTDIQDAIKYVESLGEYSFDGWYRDKLTDDTYKNQFDISGTFEGLNNETVYAKWIPTYKLTFKYNNPPADATTTPPQNPQTPDYEGETTKGGVMKDPEKLPAPEYEKDRYSFDAWYILEPTTGSTTTGSTRFPNAESISDGNLKGRRGVRITSAQLATYPFANIAGVAAVNKEIVLEANWTAPYGIVFDANGGRFTDGKSETIVRTDNTGKLTSLPTAKPEREGYEFLGWFYGPLDQTTNPDPRNPKGDEVAGSDGFPAGTNNDGTTRDAYTVYAKWEKQIKITIAYGNGNIKDVELYVTPNSTDTDSTKPKYYAFSDDEIKKYFQDIKVSGYTIPEKVTVSPMPDSTDTTIKPPTSSSTTPTEVTLNQIKTLKFISSKSPYVIGATLVPGYFITLDANGGEITGGTTSCKTDTRGYISVTELDAITAEYKDDAKKFLGWSTSKTSYVPIPTKDVSESTGTVKYYVFTGTSTIYAAWGPPYKITYNLNGGKDTSFESSLDSELKQTDEKGKYPSQLPIPTYNTDKTMAFDGWNTQADGMGTAITKGENPALLSTATVTEPVTLYAQWRNYKITLNANGGTLTSSSTVEADNDGKINRPADPRWDAHTFNGWSTNPGATTAELYTPESFAQKTFAEDTILYAVWTTAGNSNSNGGGTGGAGGTDTTSSAQKKTPVRPSAALAIGNTPMLTALPTPPFNITFKFNTPADATPPAGPEEIIPTDADGKLSKLPEKAPEITGYEFKGWYRTPSGEGPVTTGITFDDTTDVYAYWEPIITFNANGGLLSGDKFVVTAENKISKDSWPTATRKGYTFTGWYDKEGSDGKLIASGPSPTTIFNKPTELYAHWEPNKYTITFDLNFDGAPALPTQQTTGTIAESALPKYERPGYTLVDWYTEEVDGEKVTEYTFVSDKTVYAHWAKTVTITLDYRNGTGKTDKLKVVGGVLDSSTPFPTDASMAGKYGPRQFQGWYTEETGGVRYTDGADFSQAPFDKDITLYAHWDNSEVKVTFNDTETGTNVTMDTENGGKLTSFPQLPRVPGKKFLGWKLGTEFVTLDKVYSTDTTLTGEWTSDTPVNPSNNPVVTFYIDIPPMPTDDAGQSEVAHFTMVANSTGDRLSQLPTLVGAAKFSGWHEKGDDEPVKPSKVYNGNTNLYVSLAKTYQITLDWNNGDANKVSDKVFVYTGSDGKIAAADWPDPDTEGKRPERPGCYFDNWYTAATGGEIVPKNQTFTSPTVIYAHWKSPYTITFDANGGAFPDGKEKIERDTDIAGSFERAKIPADPSRKGYTKFGGWATSADGSGGAVDPATYKQPYTDPMTFYAIWGPPYAIEYDAMGGTVTPTDEQKLTTEDGKYPELPTPTREKHSFGGWFTTKDFQEGTRVEKGGDCSGAVTLYAKWTREPPYTITFDANRTGVTVEDPVTGAEGATVTVSTDKEGILPKPPADPKSRGDTFAGWFTEKEDGDSIGKQEELKSYKFTDDITLYAHWGTMDFTITFDYNLSQIMSDPLNITTTAQAANGTLTYLPNSKLPQAASGDYEIEGWYKVPNPGKDDKPVTKGDIVHRDTTLYAKWKKADNLPIVFEYPNITFMNENDKPMITLEVEGYKMTQLPQLPYKEGYTAAGWVTRAPDGTETPLTTDTQITGSVIAYPKYNEIAHTYTVTFEPGEESELDPIKVTTTGEGRIPDGSMPSPTWEGHTFSGWYTSAEGGTKITRRTVFTQDTTVYAHWDKSGGSEEPVDPDDPNKPDKPGPTSPPFTITFNPNGGNLNANTTALTDLNGRLMSLPTPARTGYHFDGWYNGNERITTATVFSANTTLTAQWTTGSGGGSSGGGDSSDTTGYAITVANTTGGRVSVSTTYAREGDRVTVTVRPYSGYQLDRVNVVNARGYDVELRDQGSNRYVFYMPASRVTVDAAFMELIAGNGSGNTGTGSGGNTGGTATPGGGTSWNPGGSGTGTTPSGGATSGMGIFSQPVLNTVPMPYLDVHPSDWYYSSVDYMWQRQLMGGVSSNRFGPQATTSNAMVWTILARLAGVDVTSGAAVWYENARSWAVSNRISDGVGPNSAVTREQLATMLWNFKGSPAVGYDLGQFGDRGQISTYQAECALSWAVANNIVTGAANRLNPRGTATRAEVAAMITRFCQNT